MEVHHLNDDILTDQLGSKRRELMGTDEANCLLVSTASFGNATNARFRVAFWSAVAQWLEEEEESFIWL